MTEKWKACRLVAAAALSCLMAGCSGINASHSVSPATFFLPGLLKADPPPQTEPLRQDGALPPALPVWPDSPSTTHVALAR